MIFLDTNAVIAVLNNPASPVRRRVNTTIGRGGGLALSSIVLFELWYGAAKSTRPDRNIRRIIDFLAGEIRATLERGGSPIGPYDLLIAAQARRRNALLVTANGREFQRVPGLRCEDWAKSD